MTIHISLSAKSLQDAKKQLKAYRKELESRQEEFIRRLLEKGVEVAMVRFLNAAYSGENDVSVSFEQNGLTGTIYANGKAVAFIEFGAGTSQPGYTGKIPAGISKRGEYGKGHGADPEGWLYQGEPGTLGEPVLNQAGDPIPGLYHTKGNPPAMAMWGAYEEMAGAITEIWREVMA